MSIKRGTYKYVTNDNGDTIDIYFKTDTKQIVIVDGDGKETGTLDDLLLKGKSITDGNINQIKESGMYKIKGLTGLPQEVSSNDIGILITKSIKDNEIDLIFYNLIMQDGLSYQKIVSNGKDMGWISVGKDVDNTLGKLGNSLKDNSNEIIKIKTKDKEQDAELSEIGKLMETHNHDNRYILKEGDKLSGDLSLKNGIKISLSTANGTLIDGIKTDSNNNIIIGDSNYDLILNGKDVKINDYNISDIFEKSNKTNGVNAQFIGGVSHNYVAYTNKYNKFESINTFSNISTFENKVVIRDFVFDPIGSSVLEIGKDSKIELDSNANVLTPGSFQVRGIAGSNGFLFKQHGSKGFGFVLNDNTGDMVLKNLDNNTTIFNASPNEGTIQFTRYITIDGKRLYLQSSQPTGRDIPDGSVWIG